MTFASFLFLTWFSLLGTKDTVKVVNPVISDYKIHDVSLIQDNNTFYAFSSCNLPRDSSEHIPYYGGNVFKSKDLVNWTYSHQCIDNLNLKGYALWAPDIIKYKGQYLLFAALRKNNDQSKIALFESDQIEGKFKFKKIVVSNEKSDGESYFSARGIIDPFPIEDKGKLYLVFGSFSRDDRFKRLKNRDGIGVYIVELDSKRNYQMKSDPIFITDYYEGVSIIKRKNQYFLFGTNGNLTNHSYQINFAYSSNILGPYLGENGLPISDTVKVNPGKVILKTEDNNLRYNGFGCMSQPIVDRKGRYWVLMNGHDLSLPPIYETSSQRERYVHLVPLYWDDNNMPYFVLEQIENNTNQIIFKNQRFWK